MCVCVRVRVCARARVKKSSVLTNSGTSTGKKATGNRRNLIQILQVLVEKREREREREKAPKMRFCSSLFYVTTSICSLVVLLKDLDQVVGSLQCKAWCSY